MIPYLQFFEEIFAFEPEFDFQRSMDIAQKVTAIEWLNQGYHGIRPSFLASNEKSVKLYQLKERETESFRSESDGTSFF